MTLAGWVPYPGSIAVLNEGTFQIFASKTVRDQGDIYAYFLQLRR